jgi:hypothetical protein
MGTSVFYYKSGTYNAFYMYALNVLVLINVFVLRYPALNWKYILHVHGGSFDYIGK